MNYVNQENKGQKERKKMAVSKATLSYVDGEVGTRLIEDVKSTKANKNIIKKYRDFVKKLESGEFGKR